jgi:hypothetical protein
MEVSSLEKSCVAAANFVSHRLRQPAKSRNMRGSELNDHFSLNGAFSIVFAVECVSAHSFLSAY